MRDFEPADPSLLQQRRLLRVTASRNFEASPTRVWAVISDHTTWTAWHEDYDEHRALSEQTAGLGARFATKEWVLHSESEIVRWEPGRAMGLTIVRASGLRWLLRSYVSELVIESDGESDRCRVSYRSAFTGTALFWLFSAYTVGQTLGSIYLDARRSLARLERYLAAAESPGPTEPPGPGAEGLDEVRWRSTSSPSSARRRMRRR